MSTTMSASENKILAELISIVVISRAKKKPANENQNKNADEDPDKNVREKVLAPLFLLESQGKITVGGFLFREEVKAAVADIVEIFELTEPQKYNPTPSSTLFDEYAMYSLSRTRSIQRWWKKDEKERSAAKIRHEFSVF